MTCPTPPAFCWSCRTPFECGTDVEGHRYPLAPGMISICISCAAIGIFRDDLTVRKPTVEETAQLLARNDIVNHVFAVRLVQERKS